MRSRTRCLYWATVYLLVVAWLVPVCGVFAADDPFASAPCYPSVDRTRAFQDATGSFSIEAEFLCVINRDVILRKSDHSVISVPYVKLSGDDQVWVMTVGKHFDYPFWDARMLLLDDIHALDRKTYEKLKTLSSSAKAAGYVTDAELHKNAAAYFAESREVIDSPHPVLQQVQKEYDRDKKNLFDRIEQEVALAKQYFDFVGRPDAHTKIMAATGKVKPSDVKHTKSMPNPQEYNPALYSSDALPGATLDSNRRRKFLDETTEHSLEGDFLCVLDGTALIRPAGKFAIAVPIHRLSSVDQEWIARVGRAMDFPLVHLLRGHARICENERRMAEQRFDKLIAGAESRGDAIAARQYSADKKTFDATRQLPESARDASRAIYETYRIQCAKAVGMGRGAEYHVAQLYFRSAGKTDEFEELLRQCLASPAAEPEVIQGEWDVVGGDMRSLGDG